MCHLCSKTLIQTHPDPNNKHLGQVCKIYDQINSKVKELVSSLKVES
jgi:hypothetical protein